MRYIDADKELYNLSDDLSYKASVKRVLMQAPEADVMEVCRCKYCVHYEADIICEGVGYCNEHQKGMRDNDFCSYGERRKDDGV